MTEMIKAIEWEKYDQVQVKSWQDLKEGDVVRLQYGEFLNWVTAAVIRCEADTSPDWHRFTWVSVLDRQVNTSYGMDDRHGHDYEVLGRVKNIEDIRGQQ